jgi:hypothetical protein
MFVALFEYRDRTLKTDEDVTAVLALPVLAVVPRMRSDVERRREFKRRAVMNVGLGTTVMVCLAVLVYTYFR